MAAYHSFQGFVGYLGLAAVNLNTDTIKVYAAAAAASPSASADDVKTDIAEITAENGYPSGGSDTTNTYAEVTGTGTVTVVDVTWTATGTGFGPLQYVVAYDDTHASDILVCWWDYGSEIAKVNAGETFTVDFTDNKLFTIAGTV